MAGEVRGRLEAAVTSLPPGCFAVVMAAGIVSIGMHLQGHLVLSAALLWLACAQFAALLVLTGWRLVAHRAAVLADVASPRRGFGFFTAVAGANVIGVRLAMDGYVAGTAVLLVVAGLAWLVAGSVVPWASVVRPWRRGVVATADGTWFLWCVATQSVAVAASTLEPLAGAARSELALLAGVCWSVGACLYVAAAVLVGLRLARYGIDPRDLNPSYWVAMGASAISALAGARVVEMVDTPVVVATRGLASTASVVFWVMATALLPVLLAAGWWRHRLRGVPLKYEAMMWSLVFPLGMYAVAAISVGTADRLPLARAIGGGWVWVAFAVWLAVFTAMMLRLAHTLRGWFGRGATGPG